MCLAINVRMIIILNTLTHSATYDMTSCPALQSDFLKVTDIPRASRLPLNGPGADPTEEEVIRILEAGVTLNGLHPVEEDPCPAEDQIQRILEAGICAPDFYNMRPWQIIPFMGDDRIKFGEVLKRAHLEVDPNAPKAKLELEAQRFLRAPLVLAVISCSRDEGKAWVSQQRTSADLVCHELCRAADKEGFGYKWMMGPAAKSSVVLNALGYKAPAEIAGFIYIGRKDPNQKHAPKNLNLSDVVRCWEPGDDLSHDIAASSSNSVRHGGAFVQAGGPFTELGQRAASPSLQPIL